MTFLCRLGLHSFGRWIAHTDGMCVFVSEVHIFRKCARCPKMQNDWAQIQNGK